MTPQATQTLEPIGTASTVAPQQPGILFQLLLIHRIDAPPGPAMQWLAERIAEPPEVG